MLSYQHGYHAGNLADVHKHSVLAVLLDYMGRKDKPLSYIETHAGRGLYDLASPEALKTGEAAAGISAALPRFAADHPYRRVVERVRARHGATAYPGSPRIAAELARPGDRMHLAELHPREFAALSAEMRPRGADCRQEEGLAMARALCPPEPRRGLLVIDPSYEVKADYATLPPAIAALHRKWNVGVILLWYPLLASGAERAMVSALDALSLPGAARHELGFPPARAGHGMIGSGLFIVNPPYPFRAEASALEARLAGIS